MHRLKQGHADEDAEESLQAGSDVESGIAVGNQHDQKSKRELRADVADAEIAFSIWWPTGIPMHTASDMRNGEAWLRIRMTVASMPPMKQPKTRCRTDQNQRRSTNHYFDKT
jgi:hypothetical protein